jgi:hypothetical protein
MKISGYKIYDTGTNVGAASAQFVDGSLEIGGTATKSSNWESMSKRQIVSADKKAVQLLGGFWGRTVTFANNAVKGEKFTITFQISDSRQTIMRRFSYYAVGSDTPTVIAAALADQINAVSDETKIIAFASSGSVDLTATENIGNIPITAGSNSLTVTTTITGSGQDSRQTNPAYFEDEYGIPASEFGAPTRIYAAYLFKYLVKKDTVHGIVEEEKSQIAIFEQAVVLTPLDDAIAGNYAAIGDLDGNLAI